MKRITLWVLSTVSALVLLFGYGTSTSGPLATNPPISIESSASSGSSSGTSSGSSQSAAGSSGGEGTGSSSTEGSTGSTTVTGSVASTRWGPVQVQVTVAGDKITDVSVVQYPTNNPKDVEINNYALPILTQETIDAQSASVDMVSGATVTSMGYVQSLQSALDQAGL